MAVRFDQNTGKVLFTPDVLRGSDIIPVVKIKSGALTDPEQNCCCCTCWGDNQLAYMHADNAPHLYQCINADFEYPPQRFSTVTVTISGTPVPRGVWEFVAPGPPPIYTKICDGTTPDPTGDWVFDLIANPGGFSKSYIATTLACSDYNFYYYNKICMGFSSAQYGCSSSGGTGGVCLHWNYVTRTINQPKSSGPLPDADGVWRFYSLGCIVGGGEGTSGFRKLKPYNPAGYQGWVYKNGAWSDPEWGLPGTYYCKEHCNSIQCVNDCAGLTAPHSSDDSSHGTYAGGVDMSGISVSALFSV